VGKYPTPNSMGRSYGGRVPPASRVSP